MTGIVTVSLILSGAVIVENMEKSYYCKPEDNVKECLWLSKSGITCSYLLAPDITKGDRCVGGVWEPLELFVDQQTPAVDVVKVHANGKDWVCKTDNGFVYAYSKCSSGAYDGYLGEFI